MREKQGQAMAYASWMYAGEMKDSAGIYPYLIALGTIVGLYALSTAPLEQYRFLGFDLKGVHFPSHAVRQTSLPATVAPALAPPRLVSQPIQTAMLATQLTFSGTTGTLASTPTLSSAQTGSEGPQSLLVDYGNSMRFFYQALGDYERSTKGAGMIKVAYVGDSQIEGDVITKDLRALLQGRFGGTGIGFMKIIAEDAPFRADVIQTFSDDWTVEALNRNTKESKFWFGPVFISDEGSWVNYDIPGRGAQGVDLYLLYRGDGIRHRIKVRINTGPETIRSLEPEEGMHFTKVHSHDASALKGIRITFPDAGVKVYGVFFQGETGIYVDNYSLRGHKGLELVKVAPDIVSQVRQTSPYKLIILQFGVNVAYAQAGGFRLYEKGISSAISHIRDMFPDSSIIVVSTSDRCVKDGETVVSDPGILELVQAQQRAAEKEGVAFFDLYHAMGGPGAMVDWVREGYAVKDYMHVNRRGGKKIAMLFYDLLMSRGAH